MWLRSRSFDSRTDRPFTLARAISSTTLPPQHIVDSEPQLAPLSIYSEQIVTDGNTPWSHPTLNLALPVAVLVDVLGWLLTRAPEKQYTRGALETGAHGKTGLVDTRGARPATMDGKGFLTNSSGWYQARREAESIIILMGVHKVW